MPPCDEEKKKGGGKVRSISTKKVLERKSETKRGDLRVWFKARV
jgi:hypothetical protein